MLSHRDDHTQNLKYLCRSLVFASLWYAYSQDIWVIMSRKKRLSYLKVNYDNKKKTLLMKKQLSIVLLIFGATFFTAVGKSKIKENLV